MGINQFPEITKFAAQKSYMRLVQTDRDSACLSISVAKNGADGKLWFLDTVNEELNSAVPQLPVTALPLFLVEKITYEKQSIGSKIFNGFHVVEKRDRSYAVIDLDATGEYTFLGLFTYDTTTRKPLQNSDGKGIGLKGVEDADYLRLISGVVKRINDNKPAWDQRRETWDHDQDFTAYGLLRQQQAADRKERAARKA